MRVVKDPGVNPSHHHKVVFETYAKWPSLKVAIELLETVLKGGTNEP